MCRIKIIRYYTSSETLCVSGKGKQELYGSITDNNTTQITSISIDHILFLVLI